jgi:hypothetical protein
MLLLAHILPYIINHSLTLFAPRFSSPPLRSNLSLSIFIISQWEQEMGFIDASEDVRKREQRWERGENLTKISKDNCQLLAQRLCEKARAMSVENDIDSPFAKLAKENDIMWSGGMPDDCTVVALHVVGSHVE